MPASLARAFFHSLSTRRGGIGLQELPSDPFLDRFRGKGMRNGLQVARSEVFQIPLESLLQKSLGFRGEVGVDLSGQHVAQRAVEVEVEFDFGQGLEFLKSCFGHERHAGFGQLPGYPSIIPAMVADRREARVPPSTARMPNSERVFRWPGAREPIPPICMPMEAKFANPHSM